MVNAQLRDVQRSLACMHWLASVFSTASFTAKALCMHCASGSVSSCTCTAAATHAKALPTCTAAHRSGCQLCNGDAFLTQGICQLMQCRRQTRSHRAEIKTKNMQTIQLLCNALMAMNAPPRTYVVATTHHTQPPACGAVPHLHLISNIKAAPAAEPIHIHSRTGPALQCQPEPYLLSCANS